MIWMTADAHHFHRNIIKYCIRPFNSIKEMDDALIENWNSVVSKKDTVYHLGDFCFDKPHKYLDALKGNKLFIRGNHDQPLIKALGSQNVPYMAQIDIKGYPLIMLSHFALRVWPKSRGGSYHLHGHSHGKLEPLGNSVDVGVDSPWITGKPEYRPFSIEEIDRFFRKRNDQIAEKQDP